MDELVQRIVIVKTGSRLDIIHCAAEAALRSYLAAPYLGTWEPWVKSTLMTVEWADQAAYAKAVETGEPTEACWGQARALGFAPCRQGAFQGSESAFTPETYCREGDDRFPWVTVAVNEAMRMPAQVAAAVAAQTIWCLWLALSVRAQREWVEDDLVFHVSGMDGARYMTRDGLAPVLPWGTGAKLHVVGFTELYGFSAESPERLAAVGLKVSLSSDEH
jgi:hypothetical protein